MGQEEVASHFTDKVTEAQRRERSQRLWSLSGSIHTPVPCNGGNR